MITHLKVQFGKSALELSSFLSYEIKPMWNPSNTELTERYIYITGYLKSVEWSHYDATVVYMVRNPQESAFSLSISYFIIDQESLIRVVEVCHSHLFTLLRRLKSFSLFLIQFSFLE